MPHYLRATLRCEAVDVVPADAVINTWHFRSVGAATLNDCFTEIKTNLDAFYVAVKAYLSGQINWNNNTLEFISLADPRPRYPVHTDTVAFGTLTTSNYDWPAEVAICLSMRGNIVSGDNAARKRGRVYLGPLQGTNNDLPRWTTGGVDAVATAGAALVAAGTNTELCVYSRYTHYGVPVGGNITDFDEVPANLEDSFTTVTTVWVDNAWDTQRRRGVLPNYRKTI